MEEMTGIASRTRRLEGTSLERAERALSFIDAARRRRRGRQSGAEFATYFEAVA